VEEDAVLAEARTIYPSATETTVTQDEDGCERMQVRRQRGEQQVDTEE